MSYEQGGFGDWYEADVEINTKEKRAWILHPSPCFPYGDLPAKSLWRRNKKI